MQYVNLGGTGLRVSRICLGMMSFGTTERRSWHLVEDEASGIVERAADLGVCFYDTADMYDLGASEEVTGRLLRRIHPRREDYVLGTKVYFPMGEGPNDGGLSRKHVLSAIDASLGRLGTDYVDLYQVHRWDPRTPVEETMQALHDVVRSGRARYVGASSMFAWQFAKAQYAARTHGWTPFVSMQNHYNLAYREEEREMIPCCLDQGVGVLPYSPLARGLLARRTRTGTTGTPGPPGTAGTRRDGDDPLAGQYYGAVDEAVVQDLHQVADARGVPAAQVALAWLMSRPGVTAPIVGATKVKHVEDAVGAVDLELADDEVKQLESSYQPHPVLGHQ